MNLRARFLVWLLPVIFILGGVMYAYSKLVLKNEARLIEEEHAQQEIDGIRQMISYELDDLDGTTREWAARDETAAFARQEDGNFIYNNLSAVSLHDVDDNLFLLLRADGSVIHAAYYDPGKTPAELKSMTAEQVVGLRQRPFVTQLLGELAYTRASSSRGEYISARGLVSFDNRLMLIAAAPVLANKGKSAGTAGLLLMGRYLDANTLYKIGHVTDLKVKIVPLNEGLQHGLISTTKTIITHPDSQTLTAYLRLDDIEGRPIGVLRATGGHWTTRRLHSQYYLLGSLLVAFLTLIGVVLWLLNHLMLQRLTLYDRIIDQIRKTDDMRNLRVPLHGRDELDRLGATVNEMLDTLANSHQRLYHDAYHDVLTGLPNRRLFIDRLNKIIHDSQHRLLRLGVVLLDLDGFKQINDTYGHDHGDELLRAVARRLEHCVRQTDTVARFGGDEFVVLLYNLDEDQTVEWIARKIISALGQPYNIQDKSVTISASAGVALYPYNGGTAEKLLKTADVLMYHAKSAGKNTYSLADGIPRLATDGSDPPT